MEHSRVLSADHEQCIDILRSDVVSSEDSRSDHPSQPATPNNDGQTSIATQVPELHSLPPTSSTSSNSRNDNIIRRNTGGYNRRDRSPLNSGLWISIESVVTVCQIIASIVVLLLSRNEKPQTPLLAWVVGYSAGCVATLPLLYWRYHHWNSHNEQESTNVHPRSSQVNTSVESTYISIPVPQAHEEGEQHRNLGLTWVMRLLNTRLNVLVDHFKMALDCFFAVWFVVGNVWIFGGHSSASAAPNLYRLCIVFLTFSCIGYAMPFILCVTVCCCLPCIISVFGFREELGHPRGATTESINALPIYKFRLKGVCREDDEKLEGQGEGGILASGTDKERVVSSEDAVCTICLVKYADNEDLRELVCQHFFHVECIDKWLKINATCPLCKSNIGEGGIGGAGASHSQRRAGVGSAGDSMANGLL